MRSEELYITSWARISSGENGTVRLRSVSIDNVEEQSLKDVYRKLNIDYSKFFKMDAQCRLGFLGSHLILDEIREELDKDDEAVSLLFANRSSSLKTDLDYQETVGDSGTGSPAKFVYTLPNIVIGEICIYWKQYGETQFLVLPEFHSEVLLKHAQIMISLGFSNHVLLGWTEVRDEYLDGLFVLLSKNGKQLATVTELSQLYGN